MYPFSYAVSLRIWHPEIDAALISDTLKLPSHPVAPGLRSFWRHRYDNPQDSECAAFIYNAAAALKDHSEFFRRIRAAGGRIEFFIGWGSKRNFGDVFPHETLALLALLQVDLSFDIYPDRANVA
jgi:hypothetical protein